jgi:hypothetical protein
VALAAAGCGGDDSDAPTKEEFITQGGANPLAEASRLAAEYGMKDCGQG